MTKVFDNCIRFTVIDNCAFILKQKAEHHIWAQLRYFTPFIQNGHFRILTFKAVDIFYSLDQKGCISKSIWPQTL